MYTVIFKWFYERITGWGSVDCSPEEITNYRELETKILTNSLKEKRPESSQYFEQIYIVNIFPPKLI